MELSERKKAILRSVVDAYIMTGEPVGSKYLTANADFNVSSATLRNEMSALESMGYLEQPHTSAGRVPTAKGYRTYVENLMGRYYLAMEEVEVLDEVIESKLTELSTIMEEASHAIGEVTNYTSFAFIGGSGTEADRYETLLISEHDFLLIMICKDGSVRSRQVKTKETINNEIMEFAKNALNKCFVGITPEQVNLNTVIEFESAMGEYRSFASMLLRVVNEMFNSFDSEKVHIDGMTKLLSHPEFFNVAKVQSVLSMIEERKRFSELMKKAVPGQTSIIFGEEAQDIAPPGTGFVFHPISVGGKVVGAVGVIGPKRMDYKKVIASLDYFAESLTEQIDKDFGAKGGLLIGEATNGKREDE
ncbi:MAG: heat-inducible transcription repressor HrcA [Ruminococcaceae bacterium]|nr:heat-inducible transcription repressor HrcA [Oscillospiraceae bacterium]